MRLHPTSYSEVIQAASLTSAAAPYCVCLWSSTLVLGVHNGIRAEFFLAPMHIASLTDYSTSKVAKIVVTHKILSVRAEGYKFPNSHQLQKSQRESFFFFFCEWKCLRGFLAWFWSGWIDDVVVRYFSRSVTTSFLRFTTNGVLVSVSHPSWSLCTHVCTHSHTS